MPRTYLVECYWPGVTEADLAAALARPEDEGAHCLESILVPEDEIVLCVYEGPSEEAVRQASRRSGLPSERITESIRLDPPKGDRP